MNDTAETVDNIEIILSKEINAPVESVFNAWTQPELIKQWFAPGSVMTVPNARVDLKTGGEYEFHMHNPESNEDFIVAGTYEEISENKKLVFNWKWRDGVDCSQVTIEFKDLGNRTELTLTHRGFSQQEFADKHHQGWMGCLHNLEGHFA